MLPLRVPLRHLLPSLAPFGPSEAGGRLGRQTSWMNRDEGGDRVLGTGRDPCPEPPTPTPEEGRGPRFSTHGLVYTEPKTQSGCRSPGPRSKSGHMPQVNIVLEGRQAVPPAAAYGEREPPSPDLKSPLPVASGRLEKSLP